MSQMIRYNGSKAAKALLLHGARQRLQPLFTDKPSRRLSHGYMHMRTSMLCSLALDKHGKVNGHRTSEGIFPHCAAAGSEVMRARGLHDLLASQLSKNTKAYKFNWILAQQTGAITSRSSQFSKTPT
jgi:hypothetical protein